MVLSNPKKHSLSWLRSWLSAPVTQLIYMTLLFGLFTFGLFWLIKKFEWLPTELIRPGLSQEDTGLFDALGGWALGFAGAIVAIRIAGIAKNIQLNDSIREQIKLWEAQVERVSELNSKLTRSFSDAKRACAAVLMHAKIRESEQQRLYLWNPKPEAKITSKASELYEPEEKLQHKLEEKLEKLVETIEEALKDSVFRSVLQFSAQPEQTILDSASQNQLGNPNRTYIDSFFSSAHAREEVEAIVRDEEKFFDVLTVLNGLNQGARNFGIGLVELRAMPLMSHFQLDLKRLTNYQFQNKRQSTTDNKLDISEAAWLFLGLLLSRRKKANTFVSQNDGFVIIALLLGSLPTETTIKHYLNSKFHDIVQTYSGEGSKTLALAVDTLSKRLYYLKGVDLSELADLINKCSNNLAYLDVLTKNTGMSDSYPSEKKPHMQKDLGKNANNTTL